jgi:hypothetical protein
MMVNLNCMVGEVKVESGGIFDELQRIYEVRSLPLLIDRLRDIIICRFAPS